MGAAQCNFFFVHRLVSFRSANMYMAISCCRSNVLLLLRFCLVWLQRFWLLLSVFESTVFGCSTGFNSCYCRVTGFYFISFFDSFYLFAFLIVLKAMYLSHVRHNPCFTLRKRNHFITFSAPIYSFCYEMHPVTTALLHFRFWGNFLKWFTHRSNGAIEPYWLQAAWQKLSSIDQWIFCEYNFVWLYSICKQERNGADAVAVTSHTMFNQKNIYKIMSEFFLFLNK